MLLLNLVMFPLLGGNFGHETKIAVALIQGKTAYKIDIFTIGDI